MQSVTPNSRTWPSQRGEKKARTISVKFGLEPEGDEPERIGGAGLKRRDTLVVRAVVSGTTITNAPIRLMRFASAVPLRRKVFVVAGVIIFIFGYRSATSLNTLNVLSVMGPVVLVIGIVIRRPKPVWPWLSLVAMTILFAGAVVARSHYETLGNLTKTRTLIPDLIAIPGYLFLAAGLVGFVIARTRATKHRLGIVYDAVIASLALFACLYVYLIEPILARDNSPATVRFVLVCYPALSMFFVAITIQLAFGSDRKRSASERLLLATMCATFAGDMIDMFGEIGDVTTLWMFVLPYSMAYLCLMACVLDPSMGRLTEPSGEVRPNWSAIRITLVAVAFIVPALLVLQSHNWSIDERITLFAIIIALTGTAILQIVQALHAVQKSEVQLKYQALHDGLTGLPNRRYLEEYLRATGGGRRGHTDVAILFLDLDRFKLINDTLGHTQGDLLLIQVAERLQANVRPGDLVARIGGDEFVVVVTDETHDVERTREYANRIRGCLREPIVIDDAEFFVTASMGLAYKPLLASIFDTDVLLREADTAMYQAKEAGRDAVAVFDDAMRTQLEQRVEVEHDLRYAASRGELHLVYQPIVTMTEHEVVGMEALVRWAHPTLGVLLPARFIPLAEESDLISEIGSWVLGEALSQIAIVRAQPGLENLTVAVNLSAIQLHDELLVQRVGRSLSANNLPGSALVLELTESAMMNDLDAAIDALNGLRRLGIKVSIDDFGTEYSSLAYIQRLPVDTLKIDRSFVTPLRRDDTSSESLVAAIVAMARARNLDTVAEGVETVEQAERLAELGADAAQGYLFARPVRADKLLDVIALMSRANVLTGTGGALAPRSA